MALSDNDPIGIETDFSRPGLRMKFKCTDVVWEVRPERVVIESTARDDNCGVILSKVLEWLPVTPISAVGHNFAYVGISADLPSFPREGPFGAQGAIDGYTEAQRTWHLALVRSDITFNLQVTIKPVEAVLSANVNFTGGDSVSEAAIEFARDFSALRQESADLFVKLVGVKVSA